MSLHLLQIKRSINKYPKIQYKWADLRGAPWAIMDQSTNYFIQNTTQYTHHHQYHQFFIAWDHSMATRVCKDKCLRIIVMEQDGSLDTHCQLRNQNYEQERQEL